MFTAKGSFWRTTIITLLITLSSSLHIQAEGEFKKIWNRSMWPNYTDMPNSNSVSLPNYFKQFGNLTHFLCSYAPYIALDNNGNKWTYTKENTGNDGVDRVGFMKTFIFCDSHSWILKTNGVKGGLLFIENADTEPNFPKFIDVRNLPVIPYMTGIGIEYTFYGFGRVYIPQQDSDSILFNFYISHDSLYKTDSSITELIAKYPFPNDRLFKYRYIVENPEHFVTASGKIWITVLGYHTSLLEFDVLSEEWIVYDNSNLPFSWIDEYNDTNKSSHYYEIRNIFLDWDEYVPKPILPIFSSYTNEKGVYCTDNAFLYLNRTTNQYDTIRIDLPNGFMIGEPSKCNKTRKIVSVLYSMNDYYAISLASFILYDWETKTHQILAPPDSLFFASISNLPYMSYADDYIDKDGNLCIGLLYNNGDFIAYNPKTGIFSNESKLIPDFKVYPNPTRHNITADIMCYLQDVSSVELGLHNILGEKVLDLSDNFEYDQSTATIRTSFQLPVGLSSGTYLLVVKSGDETRSKSIIVE